MRILRLHARAPLMGAGGVAIGSAPALLPIPGRSMITGLLGAALGGERHEGARLQELQDALEHAVVLRQRPSSLVDYHTTDLTQPHLAGPWLLSGGRVFDRGASTQETVVRHMPYWADVDMIVLIAGAADPEALARAIDHPRWPLFLGRRSCPSGWLDPRVIEAESLAAAAAAEEGIEAWVPGTPADAWLPDRRDWRSRRHGGSTPYRIVRRA
jgi:CRISPR system Cascade subunit CasD